jgi:hypothetical protein
MKVVVEPGAVEIGVRVQRVGLDPECVIAQILLNVIENLVGQKPRVGPYMLAFKDRFKSLKGYSILSLSELLAGLGEGASVSDDLGLFESKSILVPRGNGDY